MGWPTRQASLTHIFVPNYRRAFLFIHNYQCVESHSALNSEAQIPKPRVSYAMV